MIDSELKCMNDKSGPKQKGAGPIPLLPLRLSEREQGKKYLFNNKVVICSGGVLNCLHGIRRTKCNDRACIEVTNLCIHELPKKNCSICNKNNS